jgi:hypothetical protein
LSGVYGRNNSSNVMTQHRPLRVAEHNERNLPSRQVLLVPDVLVRSDDHREIRFLGSQQQRAVLKFVPTSLPSRFHGVSGEKVANE